jgi:hypothetical protein
MFRRGVFTFLGVLLIAGPAWAWGRDPSLECQASKLRSAGWYGFCRLYVEAIAVRLGKAPRYTLCDARFGWKWRSAEIRGGEACPTNGDEATIGTEITNHTDQIAVLLSGGTPPGCGNGAVERDEQCDGEDLGGATCESLGYTLDGTLSCTAGCAYDTSLCESQAFPASGQTTAHMADRNDGIPDPVSVPEDGTVRAGAALSYVDNGDGTITDLNTGLMWEKKSGDGGLHDKGNRYHWSGNRPEDTIWDWLDDVNAEGGTGFAGYNDWRIPNVKELQSIIDYERFIFSVDPVFNTGCAPPCTVTTCSCTASARYWSATSSAEYRHYAWIVSFYSGWAHIAAKSNVFRVRAVRGGL